MDIDTEDAYISELSQIVTSPTALEWRAYKLAENYKNLAHRAYFLYQMACQRLGNVPIGQYEFITEHKRAWADFLISAAELHSDSFTLFPLKSRHIYLTWHFPEYPRVLKVLTQLECIVLVARTGSWMENILGKDKLVDFRRDTRQLLRKLESSDLPVFAMIDYCYDGTRSIMSEFLGYPTLTPIGIYELAQRYNYSVSFLDWDSGVLKLFPIDTGAIEQVSGCAGTVNRIITKSIVRSAPRWLLWGSIDQRWNYWR